MKTKIEKAILQAKEQAKGLLNIPKAKEVSNEKLVAGLKKLGLATQEDLTELKERVAALEAKLSAQTPQ